MRITFILPHAGLAGGIRIVAIYADRLARRGHEVTVISTPWQPPGRKGKAWAVVRRWLHLFNPRKASPLDPSHFHNIANVRHLRISEVRAVTDRDVPDADVVVATWWETAPWVAALSPSKGAKTYFVQDYGAHAGQSIESIAATWRLPLLKIVISRFIIDLINTHVPGQELVYVPNAVDLDQFTSPPRARNTVPTVGFVHSRAPQKGCDIMLQALRLVREQIPNLKIVAYGPSSPSPADPLPPGTQYWHLAPDHMLKGIYSACDAWLFGSRAEGFGLPILEAMACRTPVIATPAGAAPELVEQGGGILVKPDDPSDMARATIQLIRSPESKWRTMSDAAYATATSYTLDDATSRFEQALQHAVSAHNSHQLTPV